MKKEISWDSIRHDYTVYSSFICKPTEMKKLPKGYIYDEDQTRTWNEAYRIKNNEKYEELVIQNNRKKNAMWDNIQKDIRTLMRESLFESVSDSDIEKLRSAIYSKYKGSFAEYLRRVEEACDFLSAWHDFPQKNNASYRKKAASVSDDELEEHALIALYNEYRNTPKKPDFVMVNKEHEFDPDKSVRWNREKAAEHNQRYRDETERLQKLKIDRFNHLNLLVTFLIDRELEGKFSEQEIDTMITDWRDYADWNFKEFLHVVYNNCDFLCDLDMVKSAKKK